MIARKPESYNVKIARPTANVPPHLAGWIGNLRAASRAGYVADLNAFAAFVRKPLHLVTRDDVRAYRDHLVDRYGIDGNRTHTVDRKLSVIKSLFSYLSDEGVLRNNVAAAVRLKGSPTRKGTPRSLSIAQVVGMIEREPKPRNRAILLTFYKAGIRSAELRSLRGVHVQPHDRGCILGPFPVKGGGEHSILLPPDVALVLASQGAEPEDPIFRSRAGNALSVRELHRIVSRAASRVASLAGVKVSPHWLRHAAATHALRRGAAFPLVQRDLGHARADTTLVYVEADPSDGIAFYLPTF